MKMQVLFLIAGCMMSGLAIGDDRSGDPNGAVTLTVLYDNYIHSGALQAKWGFSCLIEGTEQTILFDTGGESEVLAANCKSLEIDPESVDIVVISHMHWDHINGLDWLVKENDHLKIFLPDSATDEVMNDLKEKTDHVQRITDMKCICGSVFTIGTLRHQIPEQALCLETPEGLVVITGCSHPGIVRILKTAKERSGQELYLTFGGFHLRSHSSEQLEKIIEEIKELGVQKIGPTHCTGDQAIALFKEAWGENFVSMGVGKKILLRAEKRICTE